MACGYKLLKRINGFLDKAKVWIFGKFETLPKTHTLLIFSLPNY